MSEPPEYNPEAAWEQPQTGALAGALAKVQAEIPRIDKSKTAKIQGRDGKPGYEYKYADLADVSEAILPILGKHGLAFTAWPTLTGEGQFILAYTLMHESGEHRDGIYPLPNGGTAQALGSAITYGRRYCLCAVTGAAADEDDDGAAASEVRQPKQQRQQQRQELPQRRAAPANGSTGNVRPAMTTAQSIAMHWKRLGIVDDAERLNLTARMAGRTELASTNNLPPQQQEHILEALSKCRDLGQVQAWIDDKVAAS